MMDYLKMCDCPEIQEQKSAHGNGWYKQNWTRDDKGDIIWLPRQEDLQKMVSGVESVYLGLLPERVWTLQSSFNKFTHELYTHDTCDDWTSMEQLWLAFVMKELHNKIWQEDKWVGE